MAVRAASLIKARALGYAVRENLPLLEPLSRLREMGEVIDRILVLDALTYAAACGSCTVAEDALGIANLTGACSESELAYLRTDESRAPAG